MLLKKANNLAVRDIFVKIAANNFKVNAENQDYRKSSGKNMFRVNRQLRSWEISIANPDNGFYLN